MSGDEGPTTYKQEIVKVNRLTNSRGAYLDLEYKKSNGEVKKAKVFDAKIVGAIDGPGTYDLTWAKSDKGYFNIVGAKKLGGAPVNGNGNGHQAAPAAQTPAPVAAPAASATIATKPQDGRIAIVLGAMKAASKITAAMATASVFDEVVKGEKDKRETLELLAQDLLDRYLLSAQRFLERTSSTAPAKQPEPETEEVGA